MSEAAPEEAPVENPPPPPPPQEEGTETRGQEAESKEEEIKVDANAEGTFPTTYNGQPIIYTPLPHDVLSGRGAFVNAHSGNRHFRTLCWARKPAFDAGNHGLKRQLATEVVKSVLTDLNPPARFLQKVELGDGLDKIICWTSMGLDKAINKACQARRLV